MSFKDDLAAAKAAPVERLDVTVQVNGKPYVLRFSKLAGDVYAAETLRHPMRHGVPFDDTYGYNLSSLAPAIAPLCAVLVEDDIEVKLSAEDWADLFAVLDGGAAQAVQNTVFSLNEFVDQEAVARAKKVIDGLVLTLPSHSD